MVAPISTVVCSRILASHLLKTDTTFVVINFNGSRYLHDCLTAIRSQGGVDIIVVDNGSDDDSVALIEGEFPDVKLIENAANAGFARAANQGAEAAESRFVAFVNTDVVLGPGWLSAILPLFGADRDVACVGSRLLSRDGAKIDFDGGTVNFYGFGQQVRFGSPLDEDAEKKRKPTEETAFACAGAMVVDREAFLHVGGFDESFFAYFEDVDLGYRFWLAGYRVLVTREVVGYHVHHGTAARFLSDAAMAFLAERNALTFVLKNLQDENLSRVLPASLFMNPARLILRAQDALSGENSLFDTLNSQTTDVLDVLNSLSDEVCVPLSALAGPLAIFSVASHLEEILKSRADCQRLRRRGDDEILNRFPGFFFPSFFDSRYFAVEEKVAQFLGLGKVLGEERPGPLVSEQMRSLQQRLHEELDRTRLARAADQKHIQGLESALKDRSEEIVRLSEELAKLRKQAADAISAAQAKDAEIKERDRVLAEKENVISDALRSLAEKDDVIRDALRSVADRDEMLKRAEASIAEKDALVRSLESLAEARKGEMIAQQERITKLQESMAGLQREHTETIEAMQGKLEDLQASLKDVEGERCRLRAQLDKIEASFAYRSYRAFKSLTRLLHIHPANK